MLNGYPVNAAPVNDTAGGAAAPEPVVVAPPVRPTPAPPLPVPPDSDTPPGYSPEAVPAGWSFRWRAVVRIGGVDVSDLLTGTTSVDREEDSAGVASFGLHYLAGETVPTQWATPGVTVDYITETGGVTTQARLFTGFIAEPAWDPVQRVMSFTCSDQLQERIEAMPIDQIDTLIGGYFTEDVFDPAAGRSRYDYAKDRQSTIPVSLDASVDGVMRVTSWYVRPPAVVFGPGSTIFESLSVDLAQLRNITNRIEIEVEYRYARLWQHNETYGWVHPETFGIGGMGGFCAWRAASGSEVPDVEMIVAATEGAGLTMLSGASYYRMPLNTPDPCGTGIPWINAYEDLLLGAGWAGGLRWTQAVTEKYKIILTTPTGEIEDAQIIGRESTSFEVENEEAEGWERDPFTGGSSGHTNLPAEPRRLVGLECIMRRGQTALVSGHRGTSIGWTVPTSMALGVDLVHTIEFDDQQTKAIGKCRAISISLDHETGEAITDITIAVMQGGGVSDPLNVPAAPAEPVLPGVISPLENMNLPTQLGWHLDSLPYDDNINGFSGNYGNYEAGADPERYPRRMQFDAPEVPQELRDELEIPSATTIRVGIPNDLLEL